MRLSLALSTSIPLLGRLKAGALALPLVIRRRADAGSAINILHRQPASACLRIETICVSVSFDVRMESPDRGNDARKF